MSEAATGRGERVPIVGVGASAGGLDSLRRFLTSVPEDPGLAFVIVVHLSPDAPSLLGEILSRETAIETVTAEQDMAVQANRAYVIPPGQQLRLVEGKLSLEPRADRRPWLPIDHFFSTLAEVEGERAMAVLLSGMGTDGTLGLEDIRGAGGLAIAAEAGDVQHVGMVQSAVRSGVVDQVLPIQDIPTRLIEYAAHPASPLVERPKLDGEEDGIEAVLRVVKKATGHEFDGYKRGTLRRRVRRRMQLAGTEDVGAYAELVRRDPQEAQAVFSDLVIGVTSFFRTPEAFETLRRQILPDLVAGRPPTDTVRVWVPGCSTGQEPYSLAMLLAEAADDRREAPAVQIFATDVNSHALEVARAARYPLGIADYVPSDRLKRFFVEDGGGYTVVDRIRQMVLFARHSVLRDPPFSHLDMVSCRNLLIYMERKLQHAVLPVFHYALRNGGYLFLGASESIGEFTDLYASVDDRLRIYRKRPTRTRDLRFPSTMQARRPKPEPPDPSRSSALAEEAGRVLLRQFAPPAVVVSERGDLLHVIGRTAPFLELEDGLPTLNLFKLAKPGLRTQLRAAVHQAAREQGSVLFRDLPVDDEGDRRVDVQVQPVGADGTFLVTFQGHPHADPGDGAGGGAASTPPPIQHELESTRQALQSTVEELETANEEMTSSNEELLSMNEELQSANEELETSKEETQSINEELNTVNAELTHKVEELTRVNNDISNLLSATQVATLFLDTELRVTRYTPSLRSLFKLKGGDVGRHIGDITPTLDYAEFIADAAATMEDLHTRERNVTGPGDRHHLVRIMPYRTLDNRIDGAVATFVDVSALTEARNELQIALRRAGQYEHALEQTAMVTIAAGDGRVAEANGRFCDFFGLQRADLVGQPHPQWATGALPTDLMDRVGQGEIWRDEVHVEVPDGRECWLDTVAVAVEPSGGHRQLMVIQTDVTERVLTKRALETSELRFREIFDRAPMGMLLARPDDQIVDANPAICEMLDHGLAQLRGGRRADFALPEAFEEDQRLLAELLAGRRQSYEMEMCLVARGGREVLARQSVTLLRGRDDEEPLVLALLADITAAREAESRLRAKEGLARVGEMAAIIAHELRNALGGIRSAVEVIGKRLPDDEPRKQAIGEVRSRVQSLETVLKDLLRFARKPEPEMHTVALRTVVDHAVAAVQADPTMARLLIDVHGGDVHLECDPGLLERALYNVMLNGGQAMGGIGTLHVRLGRQDGLAQLRIRDTGPGLPPGDRSHHFQAFVTSRSTGTGLGLAIARTIVESHRGTIRLESPDGGGTEAVVELPAVD